MSTSAPDLPDDPAIQKAMIAAFRAENAQISATLRAHDLLVQALRVRIAKLKKQAFGKSPEKIEREIKQLELALEDLQVAMTEAEDILQADAFRTWADQQLTRLPGKSDLAKAFRYGLNGWGWFCLFLEDGRVAIENNAAACVRSASVAATGYLPAPTLAEKPSPAP